MNWIWLALIVIVVLIDILSSAFTYSWLVIGFIPAFLLGFAVSFEMQLLIAVIIGSISIAIGVKISRKYIKKTFSEEKLLVGKYIGKSFIATEDVEKECQMKVNGVFWNVKNIGNPILKDDSFIVDNIEGNKLIIRKGDE